MPYIVENRFADTQDNNTLYEKGEFYPKGNYKPSKKRIEELSNEHPRYKQIFIKQVKEKSSSKD